MRARAAPITASGEVGGIAGRGGDDRAASRQIGQHLAVLAPPGTLTGATRVLLASPVTVTTAQYRPLPANTALGLSAFYIALLTLM